jgi:hypothetical protein
MNRKYTNIRIQKMLQMLNPILALYITVSDLGRESDHLYLTNGGTEWVQVPAPAGGYSFHRYKAFDPVFPLSLTETRFQIMTPLEGDTVIPDTITYINWKTYPCVGCESPTDVKITLWCKKWSMSGTETEDADEVSVLAHSVPNNGNWLWVARVPRAWSNDDYYFLRICSLESDMECSNSPIFRISNPYAFYP